MYPVYNNHLSHQQHYSVQPSAAPFAIPPLSVEELLGKDYADNDRRVRNAISHSPSLNHEARRQCLDLVNYFRIYKNLFIHTYIHLVSCCRGRYLHLLVESAKDWMRWASVQQLSRHSVIRDGLLKFLEGSPCHQHKFLLAQDFTFGDDENDLLYYLVHCDRKPELYELARKPATGQFNEFAQIIELLWQFLMKPQEGDVQRRLLSSIYRMSRKSAYLPRAMYIPHPSISNREAIASGANGSMTKARMNGREVAIKKVLCKDRGTQRKYVELFAGEAILWHSLQHDNIVPFLGFILEGTDFNIGLVSPFYRNGNLRNYMKRYKPGDWPTLAQGFARDLAKGLAYIHDHRPPIFHGDLKADNALIDDHGHARLSDFGQSYASDSGAFLDSTRVGLAVNPIHWMAPELMTDDLAKASAKSDIYSFGCLLHEMVSGQIPFQGFRAGDIFQRVTSGGRPDWPRSVGNPLRGIAKRCWESRPEDRPSARRLVSLLAANQ